MLCASAVNFSVSQQELVKRCLLPLIVKHFLIPGEPKMVQQAGLPIFQHGSTNKDHTMPYEQKSLVRLPGSAKGKIWLAHDFNAPLPDEILDAFEGDASHNTQVIW